MFQTPLIWFSLLGVVVGVAMITQILNIFVLSLFVPILSLMFTMFYNRTVQDERRYCVLKRCEHIGDIVINRLSCPRIDPYVVVRCGRRNKPPNPVTQPLHLSDVSFFRHRASLRLDIAMGARTLQSSPFLLRSNAMYPSSRDTAAQIEREQQCGTSY